MGDRGRVRVLDRGDLGVAAGGCWQARPGAAAEGVWAGVVEGLQFVWRTPVLRTLAIVDLVATGLYMPMESVLFPSTSPTATNPSNWAGC